MRTIVVSKLGNEPALFENSLRFGMLGEWECLKLLKILSEDTNNLVYYFGKAKWNNKKALKYFGPLGPAYIESTDSMDYNAVSALAEIDEFHIVLGPHAFYNAGTHISAWETIKKSIVTDRLLERVAPQIKLMNANPKAKLFFYLSDRRFILTAADLLNPPEEIYAQSFEKLYKTHRYFKSDDYLDLSTKSIIIEPFRFETLWLYEKSYQDYKNNCSNERDLHLVIPANQVTSDLEISYSRLDKIKEFTDRVNRYSILGQWTSSKALEFFNSTSAYSHFTNGIDHDTYSKILREYKYALVLFNTKDGTKLFSNNWLTVKYWECVYNGCLTFVEKSEKSILPFIPQELQVVNGEDLADKLKRCDSDIIYKNKLLKLQNNLVLPEYFDGTYFNTWLSNKRSVK